MEAPKDFGEKARELELADTIKRKRIKRTLLVIVPLLILAILFFTLRSDIANALNPSVKGPKPAEDHIVNAISVTSDKSDKITIVQQWDLPEILKEISGLAWLDKNRFACVQDEMGKAFIYNTGTGSIEKEIPFAGPGDYEGLALAGESIWILRSDGNLFEINSLNTDKPAIKEYDTPLSAKENAEGLCFDSKNNRLLIALKEGGLLGNDSKGIYGFDLSSKKMADDPVYTIDLKNKIFAELHSFKKNKKKKEKNEALMPSAIAIHPVTGDIYITDGRNPKLLIMDHTNAIKALHPLDKNRFAQPEGITFSNSGELYISNEGVKGAGNILKLEIPSK